jgi:hypothetical protein
MTQQPSYNFVEDDNYYGRSLPAGSLPDQTYNLRPKISLTPLGKKSRACHSIAVARTTHVPQQLEPVTPKGGLQGLEESLGGPVTMEDVRRMVTDDPSIDLTPPSGNQILTPEVINHRYNANQNTLDALLDSHGFSAPGDLALHLFSPDPKGSGTSQVFAPSSPREIEAFFSTRSSHHSHHSELNSTNEDELSDSDSGPAAKENVSSNSGGRPTNHAQKLLKGCFQQLDELIHTTAVQTNRTPENLIDMWLQRRTSTRHIKSGWNKYQRYFTQADHALEERNRVGDPGAAGTLLMPIPD